MVKQNTFQIFLEDRQWVKVPNKKSRITFDPQQKQSANTPLCLRTHIKTSYDRHRI